MQGTSSFLLMHPAPVSALSVTIGVLQRYLLRGGIRWGFNVRRAIDIPVVSSIRTSIGVEKK